MAAWSSYISRSLRKFEMLAKSLNLTRPYDTRSSKRPGRPHEEVSRSTSEGMPSRYIKAGPTARSGGWG